MAEKGVSCQKKIGGFGRKREGIPEKIGGFDRKREVMPEKKEGLTEKERSCQKKN